ncbi:MAG: hypothetical protein KatS3mg103_1187 [Phycisphaerales bacterium]|nr:MAG: hypothetical protein KatS3mg103_1187 [Phycisphaerales bacterium]
MTDAKDGAPGPAPIFILGVPRSGTTLLRTLLDAHRHIACGPETPWLAEHQPASLLGLVRALRDPEHGYCASYGQPPSVVYDAARRMLDALMRAYATSRGKTRWAEKTPNNLLHLEALHAIVPDAQYVWITRDPLDVVHSTVHVAEHRRGIAPVYERVLRLSRDATVPMGAVAAALRWVSWNRRIESFLADKPFVHLTYERLVSDPRAELERLCAFLAEPFDEQMLAYDPARHDLPAWEWGSRDVAQHGRIVTGRIGTGFDRLDPPLRDGVSAIASLWHPPDRPGPLDARPVLEVQSMTASLVGQEVAQWLPADPPLDAQHQAELGEALVRLAARGPCASIEKPLPPRLGPVALALAYAGRPVTVSPANEGHARALGEHARRWGADRLRIERSPAVHAPMRTIDADPVGLRTVTPAPRAVLASLHELRSKPFVRFMARLNEFADAFGLRRFDTWSKIWEYPWLWLHAMESLPMAGLRVVDMGSELSPMPWWLATMGARVRLIETATGMESTWAAVRDRLNVHVEWALTDDETIPVPDGWAHLVTSLSVIEHQNDKARAMDEIARVLVPGGVLAMSFDVCEPDMGMAFPAWNGQALTMAQFERDIWNHPRFARARPAGSIEWNLRDIEPYLRWHKTTAEHHTYVTGAAVLRRD